MAKKKTDEVEDQPVDQYGQPLPLVVMVDKQGNEVPVRDALGLSTMHYTNGMEFAEDGMTYAKALSVLLGEQSQDVLVDVPSDGGDVVWPGQQLIDNEPGAKSD